MINHPDKGSEQGSEILDLSEIERKVVDVALNGINEGKAEEAKTELIKILEQEGIRVELVRSGSNPNIGSFVRTSQLPQGQITLMDTPNIPEELKVYNLAHEFMYLKLHELALPDPNDRSNLDHAVEIFSAGVISRLKADITMAEAFKNIELGQRIAIDRYRIAALYEDPNFPLKKSRDFLTHH